MKVAWLEESESVVMNIKENETKKRQQNTFHMWCRLWHIFNAWVTPRHLNASQSDLT